ncbi:MAG: AraC family transcriptional regulator [Thermoguttaceae bacterium]
MISRMEFYRYLPLSERDAQWGIYVTGAGTSSVQPFSPYPVRTHPRAYHLVWEQGRVLPEYQVLYITQGKGEFESATAGRRAVAAGTVILLFPGEWHRYRPYEETGWDEYWVSYNGDYPERLVRHGFLSPDDPVLGIGLDESLLGLYQGVLDRVRAEPVGYQQLIGSNVLELLAMTLALVRSQRSSDRDEALVREAKLLLQQPNSLVHNVHLARSMHISGAQYRRLFKEHPGLSPYQYYNQMRIHRAKELLRGTSLSVKEIAGQLCFESPYHFSKVFKKASGCSPTEWRVGH